MTRAAGGDREARDLVVEGLDRLIRMQARRSTVIRLGGPGQLEDAVQSAWATIFLRLHTYDPARGEPTTWAAEVARRTWMGDYGGRSFPVRVPANAVWAARRGDMLPENREAVRTALAGTVGPLPGDFPRSGRPGPDEEAEDSESVVALREALGRLPDRLSEVVRDHYGIDRPALPAGDLARRLGVSKQRVSQLIQEAHRWLRAHMGEGHE